MSDSRYTEMHFSNIKLSVHTIINGKKCCIKQKSKVLKVLSNDRSISYTNTKFYLNKLSRLFKDYNDIPHKDYKKSDAKKIKYCIEELYYISSYWDRTSDSKSSSIYIDLFTSDLDEFNNRLRILLLRLNGFITKSVNVPDYIIKEVASLVNYLDDNSLERTTGHLKCLNRSIEYLENSHPETWENIEREPFISKAITKFLQKTWRLLLGIYLWFFILSIYGVVISGVGVGVSKDAIFYGGVVVATTTPFLLYKLLKGR